MRRKLRITVAHWNGREKTRGMVQAKKAVGKKRNRSKKRAKRRKPGPKLDPRPHAVALELIN
jgi:hypothetical protein